ncbi:hypothetical protein [Bordetella genomosp. 9]|uniref:hypothetical protein n=1 Tax=Bordetella genomosp. 9 TaxID=1416803 RepID=UPI001177F5CA|nr:hypothetical protein [Bordetella genomosp. 9]
MFSAVVHLYRVLGRPHLTGAGSREFRAETQPTPAVIDAFSACENLDPRYGEYEKLDGDHGLVVIEGRLPGGDLGQFYADIEDFIGRTPSICKGHIPHNFYIVDLDYFSGDSNPPPQVVALKTLCEFLILLSNFAEGEIQLQAFKNAHSLIFVLPPDGKIPQRTATMPVVIAPTTLNHQLSHLNILRALVSPDFDAKVHIEERRLVMRLAISDVLSEEPDQRNQFTYLVCHWTEVLKRYRHNLGAYINNFSFDVVRKKIADADMEYASKLSGVLGDIAGKLLALPISLVALIAIPKADTAYAFWLGVGSAILVSIIYLLVLANQRRQIFRLRSSFNLVFEDYKRKLNSYPTPLRRSIARHIKENKKQAKMLTFTFWVFVVAAFLPGAVAIYLIDDKYSWLTNGARLLVQEVANYLR